MKSKYLVGTLLCLMLLLPISSVAAFWHPPDEVPEEPCSWFGVTIEGVGTTATEKFNFTEPEYHFCSDVTVEVWIFNVEDLYGYDFKLSWDTYYFALVDWQIEEVWEEQFVIRPLPTYDGSPWYHQAVIGVAPSPGVSGEAIKLATLTFHIENDVCWVAPNYVDGKFNLFELEARDSCTGLIPLCDEKDGYWEFWAMQPNVYIDPEEEINCVVGETFTMTVMVEDIVKMKSIGIDIWWYGHTILYLDGRELLNLEEYVINEEVLPKAEWDPASYIVVTEGTLSSHIEVYIKMDCDFPLINGTFWFMELTFKKKDPWYCGGQPQYEIDTETHEITVENASTPIQIWMGAFDVVCNYMQPPSVDWIYFGDLYGDHTGCCGYATYKGAMYTFDPVPGDLTGDGVVDLDDLMIIAGMYCNNFDLTGSWPYNDPDFWLYYYDLNDSGHIDISDVIIVAKNFGATCH